MTDNDDGAVVATFRLLPLRNGRDLARCYAAQFYDLDALSSYPRPMAELGRFCLDPDRHNPDILRIAWQKIAEHVDDEKVGMLFGCSSFEGTDANRWRRSFSMLSQKYLGPKQLLPTRRSGGVVDFDKFSSTDELSKRNKNSNLPPLLNLYLAMGGWVSDHAVIDHDLETIHVFTGLEIAKIPPGRARFMRGK